MRHPGNGRDKALQDLHGLLDRQGAGDLGIPGKDLADILQGLITIDLLTRLHFQGFLIRSTGKDDLCRAAKGNADGDGKRTVLCSLPAAGIDAGRGVIGAGDLLSKAHIRNGRQHSCRQTP